MSIDSTLAARLAFLSRVVERGRDHLLGTDSRLFQTPFTIDTAKRLERDSQLVESANSMLSEIAHRDWASDNCQA